MDGSNVAYEVTSVIDCMCALFQGHSKPPMGGEVFILPICMGCSWATRLAFYASVGFKDVVIAGCD